MLIDKMNDTIEIMELVPSDYLKPYDAKAASRELSRKKRLGEVDMNEKLPKKRTLAQLRKEFATSKWSEIENDVRYDVNTNIFYEDVPLTQIERLVELCRSIVNLDDGYQGLYTEVERAEKDAKNIHIVANEINIIIETTKQEDARLVQTILKILDVPFKRVLGDQLERIKFEGTDLENWLKTQYWKNEMLKDLIRRENYIQAIFKYSPR